ncbi:MAG: alpha/beta hydrolase domain-containing protein, partial [Janthinobacterium lividum]
REFLQLGFNADESGRRVFDGMNPHIASGRGAFNVRFGQPGRLSGTEHTEKQYPGLDSPLTYEDSFDPFAGLTAGLLDRCRKDGTCPKISHVMSDTEYWQANGSMDTTDALGRVDLPNPANVRIYQMSSAQHGGFPPTAAMPTTTGICQHVADVNSYTYTLRDLLVRLTQWVTTGRAPPASRYSTIAAGTLVEPAQVAFPAIPGVTYDLARTYSTRELYFRGFRFNARDESGSLAEPPLPIHTYNVRLPQVDADGNDLGGVRSPTLQAPLATYTSWNNRAAGYSEGDSCDLTGSTLPFAATKADRLASGDPRPSLAERYATHDGYVAAVARAANGLVRDGFLLPDDAATVVQQAQDSAVLR